MLYSPSVDVVGEPLVEAAVVFVRSITTPEPPAPPRHPEPIFTNPVPPAPPPVLAVPLDPLVQSAVAAEPCPPFPPPPAPVSYTHLTLPTKA